MTETLIRPETPSSLAGKVGLSATGLPGDLMQDVARRLQIVALLGAFVFFISNFLTPLLMGMEHWGHIFERFYRWGPGAISITMALVVAAIVRGGRLSPTALVNLGLAFEVVFSYGIAAAEYTDFYAPIQSAPNEYSGIGLSWVAVWMLFFTIVVPAPPRKALAAALLSASAVPITLGFTIARAPELAVDLTGGQMFVGMGLPYILVVLLAYVGSRVIYKLGTDVSRAREMGSYRLTDLIGRGGMGEVWKAEHRMLRRPAAIKLIPPQMLGQAEDAMRGTMLKRFEQEAQATAAMRSPHTIELYDFGVSNDGAFYYVMELLDGYDLGTLVGRFGPLPPGRVIRLLEQVCRSLAEAHESDLIHRDIKPANIFVCRYGRQADFVKLLDFGLVKVAGGGLDEDPNITSGGFAGGTPSFLAPEQAVGDPVDGRTDLYSVGCVAYFLLTGQLVFDSESPGRMIADQVHAIPTPPSQRVDQEIPAPLEQIVLQCLAKDREKRPQTAEELGEMLRRCSARANWSWEDAHRWWDRHANGRRAATGD